MISANIINNTDLLLYLIRKIRNHYIFNKALIYFKDLKSANTHHIAPNKIYNENVTINN